MKATSSLTRPLIILTGDLGSGKTSGLPFLAEQVGSEKPYFIVNEVGASDRFVGAFGIPSSRLSLLPGGCVCCEKQEELIALLNELVERPQSEFDSLILETSGLADPATILQLVSLHPKLTHQLKIKSLVYFLDAGSDREAGHLRTQDLKSLAVADVCVIAKTDMVPQEERDAFVEAVATANPTVDIYQQRRERDTVVVSVIGEGAMGQVTGPPQKVMIGHAGVSDHAHAEVLNFELPFGTSWLALSTWLIALLQAKDRGILRVKAAIPDSRGWISINGVGPMVFPPDSVDFAHGDERPLGTLVVIGYGLSQVQLVRSLKAFVSGSIRPTNVETEEVS